MKRYISKLASRVCSITLFAVVAVPMQLDPSLPTTPPITKPKEEIPVVLQKIAWCESRNRQFVDGKVLRGKENRKDVGKFQINERYHLAESKRLGMDIYTLKGNTDYALHLYKTQGSKPWNWSKPCWGDSTRVWTISEGKHWSK